MRKKYIVYVLMGFLMSDYCILKFSLCGLNIILFMVNNYILLYLDFLVEFILVRLSFKIVVWC